MKIFRNFLLAHPFFSAQLHQQGHLLGMNPCFAEKTESIAEIQVRQLYNSCLNAVFFFHIYNSDSPFLVSRLTYIMSHFTKLQVTFLYFF